MNFALIELMLPGSMTWEMCVACNTAACKCKANSNLSCRQCVTDSFLHGWLGVKSHRDTDTSYKQLWVTLFIPNPMQYSYLYLLKNDTKVRKANVNKQCKSYLWFLETSVWTLSHKNWCQVIAVYAFVITGGVGVKSMILRKQNCMSHSLICINPFAYNEKHAVSLMIKWCAWKCAFLFPP